MYCLFSSSPGLCKPKKSWYRSKHIYRKLGPRGGWEVTLWYIQCFWCDITDPKGKWATTWEYLSYAIYAHNESHMRRLVSTFVVRCLNSIITKVTVYTKPGLWAACEVEQAGLSLTWSHSYKDRFPHYVVQMLKQTKWTRLYSSLPAGFDSWHRLNSNNEIFFYLNHWYRKFPKYSDTQNICCNHSKIWTMWLYHRVMSPKDADGMANSVDPDQTAPRSSLIWVCTICPGLSVHKLRIITVIDKWALTAQKLCSRH